MSDTGNSDLPPEDSPQDDENQETAVPTRADLKAQADEILKAAAEASNDDDDLQSFGEALDGTGAEGEEDITRAIIDNIVGEREKLEEEIAELKDKLLRAMAEEQNLRRRMARELEDASKYAVTGFARDMLAVGDNLKRALDHMEPEGATSEETAATFRDGVELTARELQNAFDKHGIQLIEPLGEKFDHNLHQAMFEVPNSGQPDGTVVQVINPGFTIGDRLLRAAMVGVAKGGPAASAETLQSEPVEEGPAGEPDD